VSQIAANIEAVYQRINAAAGRAGRRAGDIRLVAVTKTHPLQTVIAAYEAGLRHFGENRAQEGRDKAMAMAGWLADAPQRAGPEPLTWHMIGHLQRRQVGDVLGQFKLIHSVDRVKFAGRINRLAQRDDLEPVEILLECNVSGEASKSGFSLDNWAADRGQLRRFVEAIDRIGLLDKVIIKGLMTMAPLADDPEETRPTFSSLAALQKTLQEQRPLFDWQELSMGMTDDFEVAIEEGATIIRVGRALFGERAAG